MPKSTYKIRNIYLDYAASVSGNPSSIHSFGLSAKKRLERARREVASVLNARESEIIFTSGGTESNNLAIQGTIFVLRGIQLPHIITTNIEHPSVLETFQLLAKRKLAKVSIVAVEPNGIVDPKKIKKEIRKNTVLISVNYANNEISTIQPIREISKIIRHYKKTHLSRPNKIGHPLLGKERDGVRFPIFHTDAVQAGNYLDLNVETLGVDLLSLSGSKLEGAGRVGVLYKKKSAPLVNIFGGGDQEMGLRPGTENLGEILKFSRALKYIQEKRAQESKRLTKLRDYFFKKLRQTLFSVAPFLINGDLENRLPNNVNISFQNIPSDLLVIELSARGIMASAKSACKSALGGGSYVIQAIHPEMNSEIGGVRFSLGKDTTKKDIDYTVKSLFEILTKLKKWYD